MLRIYAVILEVVRELRPVIGEIEGRIRTSADRCEGGVQRRAQRERRDV